MRSPRPPDAEGRRMTDILIGISIVGPFAFAAGIAFALWRHTRPRRPDPVEHFEGDWK